jgi:MFS family permease
MRAWYGVFVLYAAYVFAFVDRQILAFLVGPIRKDFTITDTQFSLINGLAFVLFYAVLGIPLGRLADTGNRRRLILVGIVAWSVMTALCGRATNYLQLFLARLGVGVGEATLAPAAVSILADSFEPAKRGLAINTFASGVHGGIGLANIFGGVVVSAAATAAAVQLPFFGVLKPWQLAFVLVAAPGILIVLLTLSLREPVRQGTAAERAPIRMADTARFMRERWFVYTTVILGCALSAVGSYGMYGWVPATYARVYGWPSARIGWHLGLLTIFFGTAGLVASGAYASRQMRLGRGAVYVRVMAIAVACAILPATAMLFVQSAYALWACIALLIFFLGMPVGLVQGALQAISPNNMRAQVIAVYLAVLNLFGLGMGSTAVAVVTDYVFANDLAVRRSMGIVAIIASLLSVIVLSSGTGAYERMARDRA